MPNLIRLSDPLHYCGDEHGEPEAGRDAPTDSGTLRAVEFCADVMYRRWMRAGERGEPVEKWNAIHAEYRRLCGEAGRLRAERDDA